MDVYTVFVVLVAPSVLMTVQSIQQYDDDAALCVPSVEICSEKEGLSLRRRKLQGNRGERIVKKKSYS